MELTMWCGLKNARDTGPTEIMKAASYGAHRRYMFGSTVAEMEATCDTVLALLGDCAGPAAQLLHAPLQRPFRLGGALGGVAPCGTGSEVEIGLSCAMVSKGGWLLLRAWEPSECRPRTGNVVENKELRLWAQTPDDALGDRTGALCARYCAARCGECDYSVDIGGLPRGVIRSLTKVRWPQRGPGVFAM
jgi:hypothetical protein